MQTVSLRKAAQRLRVNRAVLYGILMGMGMVPRRGARADGGIPPRLLTMEQVGLIRTHLAAYRRAQKGVR